VRSLAILALPGALLALLPTACSDGGGEAAPTEGKPAPELRVERLRGGPKERGRAHGEALKEEIHAWLARVRPADEGSARFAIEECGRQIWPQVPRALRDEIEGVAEGAGLTAHEILFLTTRFELQGFGMGGRPEDAVEIRGVRAEAHASDTVARIWIDLPPEELVVFVHEGPDGGELGKVLALPGMVGGFAAQAGRAAVAARPTSSAAALTGVPWPIVVRMLADGAELPRVNLSCHFAVARDGKAGVWRATTAGAEFVEAQEPEPAAAGLLVRLDEFGVTTVRTSR